MDFGDIISGLATAGSWKISGLLIIIAVTQLIRTQGSKLWEKLGTGWAAWCVACLVGVGSVVAPKLMPGAGGLGDFSAAANTVLEGIYLGLTAAGLVRGAQKAAKAVNPADPSA